MDNDESGEPGDNGMQLMHDLAVDTDSDNSFHTACGSDSTEQLASEEEDRLRPQGKIDMVKYVDDTTIVEAVDKEATIRHITSGLPQEVHYPVL